MVSFQKPHTKNSKERKKDFLRVTIDDEAKIGEPFSLGAGDFEKQRIEGLHGSNPGLGIFFERIGLKKKT
tara:strand:+ start:3214 stop:3423 length:210 start_codon:yes stop_codon:yes gene_type:complete